MHKALLDATIQTVRQRVSEGDCPDTPAYSVETLEDALLALAALSAPVEDGEIGGLIARLEERSSLTRASGGILDLVAEAATALRSLSARLAEAERDRDAAEKKRTVWEKRGNDYADALTAAIADRDRLAGLVREAGEERKTLIEAVDWLERQLPETVRKRIKGPVAATIARVNQPADALASRLKAEGGAE